MIEYGKTNLPPEENPELSFHKVLKRSAYVYPYTGAHPRELSMIAINYLETALAHNAYRSPNQRVRTAATVAVQLIGQRNVPMFISDTIDDAADTLNADFVLPTDVLDPFVPPTVLIPKNRSRTVFTPPLVVVPSPFLGAVEKSPLVALLQSTRTASALCDYFHGQTDTEEAEIRASALQAQFILDTRHQGLTVDFFDIVRQYPEGVKSAPADVWYKTEI